MGVSGSEYRKGRIGLGFHMLMLCRMLGFESRDLHRGDSKLGWLVNTLVVGLLVWELQWCSLVRIMEFVVGRMV